MQKVVTINLNGNAYQLDEAAFTVLRAYLDQAEARLKDNPDRAEILADLEQAIAEKCARFLGPHKTVVTAVDMDQVVKEMGPVEGAESEEPAPGGPRADAGPIPTGRVGAKRLYRVREGAMWAGVCNGIAAYIHVDVVFVRIAFVGLAVATFGWAMLGYWMLAFIIPEAQTADERAAAHGEPPFNAQDVVDEAKRTAERFKERAGLGGRSEWRRKLREQRRHWRWQARAWRREWHHGARDKDWRVWPGGPAVPQVDYPAPHWAGVMLPFFSLVGLACFVALGLAAFSLVSTGAIYGWPLPDGMPMWVGLLILVMVFQFVTAPIRAARHASYSMWGRQYAWHAMWDGLFATGVMILGLWLLFRHMPPVHDLREFAQNFPDAARGAGQEVVAWAKSVVEKLR